MRLSSRTLSLVCLAVAVVAAGFFVWNVRQGARQVEHASQLAGRARPVDALDATSPTGYAQEQRELILRERNEDSYHWIAQTQQMLAQHQWRVRKVDYDNAPTGREVSSTSPYRWWLGAVAWCDHLVSGKPIGWSVERAAIYADPLLGFLFLVCLTLFVARQFGRFAASAVALGAVAFFPLGAAFLAGMPDHHGLAWAGTMAALFVLLAGIHAGHRVPAATGPQSSPHRPAVWFSAAGCLGGLSLWISVDNGMPILIGLFLGALASAWAARKASATEKTPILPWRAWSLSGGATVILAWLAENGPDRLGSWKLESIHPLYGIAWIGGGELLARAVDRIHRRPPAGGFRRALILGLAIAAVAALPVAMTLTGSWGFLTSNPTSFRLTIGSDGAAAANLWSWLLREGLSLRIWAAVLPVTLALALGGLLLSRCTAAVDRASIGLLLGPVAVAAGIAVARLNWWNLLDGTLLALLVAGVSALARTGSRALRWSCAVLLSASVILGAIQLAPGTNGASQNLLTSSQAQQFIERDLAHWLARHAGDKGAIVYAPPLETTTLCYYGGLRGIGSLAPDNRSGMQTTLMIAGATLLQEVQVLLQQREVRYVVVPSWDDFFDEFAHRYLTANFANWKSVFVSELRDGELPLWLRPIPYQIPRIGGFEGQSVLLFEVVNEQSPMVANSRWAECLVETGDLERAARVEQTLRRFPADVGALAARAQVALARNDAPALNQVLETLLTRLPAGGDRFLPWDRRVSLAIVLARGKQIELSRAQLQRCIGEVNAAKLRSLTTGSLFSLEVLCQAFACEIADPQLRALALELLPADLRARL